MISISPASKRKFRGMAGLVDVDPRSLIFLCAPQNVQKLAQRAHDELMQNVILESLRFAEQLVGSEDARDVWAAEARVMRANALVVLGRRAAACVDYLVARHYMRNCPARCGMETHGVKLAELDSMIDYLQCALSKPKHDSHVVKSFVIQNDPAFCVPDTLQIMAEGQGVKTENCKTAQIRTRLENRKRDRRWAIPRGEMLFIPDDDSEPYIVKANGPIGRFLGTSRPNVVRELLFSEDAIEKRRGNSSGVSEGNTYDVWECFSRTDDKSRPNERARALLHTMHTVGPVLVQVATCLKNGKQQSSAVLKRRSPSAEELQQKEWRERRQEWLALNEEAIFQAPPTFTRLIEAKEIDLGKMCRW